MRGKNPALAIVLLLLAAGPAVASPATSSEAPAPEPTPASPVIDASSNTPRQALGISLPALSTRSLALSYERAPRVLGRFSILGIGGLRRGATGDYSSTTLSAAAELRYWLTGWVPWLRFDQRAMIGAYFSARMGIARTTTRDDVDDERIGHNLTFSESMHVGYRFVAWRKLSITPSTGVQMRHEVELDSRLPPWTQFAFTFGLTVGYLY